MAEKVKDPVCGMEVDPAKAAAKVEYKGKTYYFCAAACKKAFEKDPERYLKGEAKLPWWRRIFMFRCRG